MLRATVTDDGDGGADPSRRHGPGGVERRLATFDGILAVSSPPGGPTIVVLEVPCTLSAGRPAHLRPRGRQDTRRCWMRTSWRLRLPVIGVPCALSSVKISSCCATAWSGCSRRTVRGRRGGRQRARTAPRADRAEAGRRHRRRPAPADVHRRRAARRDRGAPGLSRPAAPGAVAVRGAAVRPRAAGGPGRRRRLPAQGPGVQRRRVRRRGAGRRRRAAPCSTPRSSARLMTKRARSGPLAALTPREREVLSLMAEGRSNAAIAAQAVHHREGGQQARRRHLRQPGPGAVRGRQPPGPRGPRLPDS